MNNLMSVCIIGLGSMGMGVAQSCIRAGIKTYGADLNPTARTQLAAAGAVKVEESAISFANELDVFILLVVNSAQVKQVLFGDTGIASHLKPNTIIMISSTISANDAKEINNQLKQYQLIMLDAPVSGGAIKAANGEMTIMASGEQSTFDKIKPIHDAIAANVYNIGNEIGLGSTVKIIHQLLAGVHIAAGAEAMALASRANIPLHIMYKVVTNAAGNSWMFENRMKHVVEGDYTPKSAVDIFVKDLGLVNDTAKALKFPLPLASTALNMFTEASNAGHGKEDDSAVIKVFSGINLPIKKGE